MAEDDFFDENDDKYEDDPYSPTSWDRHGDETDEDYEDRIQDQEDFLDYFND